MSGFALAFCVLLSGCRQDGFLNYPAGFREFAYVANRASNSVTVLDLVYMRVDRTLSVGVAPVAVASNPQRDEVYVVNRGAGSVSVIDVRDNHVRSTIAVHREPSAIAIDPSGRRAFVSNFGSNLVSVLDLDDGRELAAVASGEHPDGLALSPDGRTLVVANQGSGTVSIYNAAVLAAPHANAEQAKLVSPAGVPALSLRASFGGCSGATGPAILGDSSKAFVACPGSNQVLVLSLAAPPGSWNARQESPLLSDHALAVLDVGHNPRHIAVKPDGGEVFVANMDSDSISEISAQTNEVESTYEIGSRPMDALVSADSSALWVANSGSDSLAVYSIADGARLPVVRAGNGPDALAFSVDENLLLAADRSGDVAIIRTNASPHPMLLTILPAGSDPVAIAVKAVPGKP